MGMGVGNKLIMTTEKQNTGKLGEDLAVRYLENHGYKILGRNYRKKWGEIDIVAQQSHELVFIEVKTQKEGLGWRPEENITRHKKHQLSRIITTYLKESQVCGEKDWRIDVLAIRLDFQTQNAHIEHIKNVILN